MIILLNTKINLSILKKPSKECPECGNIEWINKIPNFCPECGHPIKQYYDNMLLVFKSKNKVYHQEEKRLINLFKEDLLKEFELQDHPKADEIFVYVWDKGHSAEFPEVYSVMDEIEHLFK